MGKFENIKYGSYPRKANFDELPIGVNLFKYWHHG